MGCVVAAPRRLLRRPPGCVRPGEQRGATSSEIADALLVGAIYGVLIARVAPVSGAGWVPIGDRVASAMPPLPAHSWERHTRAHAQAMASR